MDVVGDDPKPQYQKFNHITTAIANRLYTIKQVVDVVGDDPKSFPLTLAHAGKSLQAACKPAWPSEQHCMPSLPCCCHCCGLPANCKAYSAVQ